MRDVIIIILIIAVIGGLVYAFSRRDSVEAPPVAVTDLKGLIEKQQAEEAERTTESSVADEKAEEKNNTQTNIVNSSKSMTLEEKLAMAPPAKLSPFGRSPAGGEIEQNKKYGAVLKTTVGDIVIALDTKNTPITANNFIYLAKNNFYNNTVFHRAIRGFMIQGGDPKGDGTGGPAYKFADEKFSGEYTRGTVAMANAGPNTNGSQFFIMHDEYPLPPNYVIFGHVISGLETVDKIAEAPVRPEGEGSSPVMPVEVKEVNIMEE